MALDGVLANIPGLGGYLAMQDHQQRQQLGGLQGVIGLANAVRQHEEAQREAQLAPLRMQALQAQVGDLQRKSRESQAVETAISGLPAAQQPLARIAPQQFVAGLTKNPLEGAPEIIRLQAYAQRLREAGKTAEADQVDRVIENKEAGGTSQHERAYRTLLNFQRTVNGGGQLTPEQQLEASAARSILGRSEMRMDPVTRQPYWAQPIEIPSALTVGAQSPQQTARPTNTMPPSSSGRAPLDSASEKELNLMGDARSIARDLQTSFKDDFGGYASDIIGSAVTEYGRRFGPEGGDSQKMSQFWEAYEQWITDMRKEKFGATLTWNELAQFDRLRAKPSQTPSQIRNNLQRQLSLVEQSMGRRMTALARQGVNQDALEGAVGWGVQRQGLVNTQQKQVKRTGTLNGKRVIEYTDGTVEVQ